MGIEHELSAADIGSAAGAIFATDIEIEGRDRFDGLKIVEVPVQEAIKDPKAVIQKITN